MNNFIKSECTAELERVCVEKMTRVEACLPARGVTVKDCALIRYVFYSNLYSTSDKCAWTFRLSCIN